MSAGAGRIAPGARPQAPPALRSDPNPGILRGSLHACYDAALLLAAIVGSPWLAYRSLRLPGFGRMVLEQLGRGVPDLSARGRRRVLVHGVSVGEVKGAQPIVRAIEAAHPGLEVVVCTSTNTGLEVARRLFPANEVVRFPADLSWVVRRFLRRVDPTVVLLIELEIWPNFLRQCNRTGRPVAVVNGRITEGSHRSYRLFRKLLPQFNRISVFCVQLPDYAERFKALEVDPARIFITGNVKVDGLRTGEVDPPAELQGLLGPRAGQLVIVAGSTHVPEERLLADAWLRVAPGERLVLVPRHPHRCAEIAADLLRSGLRVQLLSDLRAGSETPAPDRIVLVDTIGELEGIYALADLVFVGGSLVPHGGQNVLEPAALGKATLFGPSVENFTQEAALLLRAGASRQVADADGLARAMGELLADPELRVEMGRRGARAVEAERGATARTLQALEALDLAGLARESKPAGMADAASPG